MQVWPVAAKMPATTPLAAASRSASSKTMLGDLPPSSSVTRARCAAAPRITALPVSVAAGERDLVDAAGARPAARPPRPPNPVTTLTTPGGKPASSTSAANSSVDADACSDGLMTSVQPAASAGASFQRHQQQRRVPGRDRGDDAERLAQRVDEEVLAVGGQRLAADLVGRAREVVVVVGQPAQLPPHLADQLAVVGRLDHGDALRVLGDQLGQPPQKPRRD